MITPRITGDRIIEYLAEGKRFDGRKPEEFREIIIEDKVSKKAEGSVRVKIGKTEVIVGVKLNVGEPYPDSPDKGNLIVSAELLPMSSDRIEIGRPGFPAIELGRIIDRGIRESKIIDTKKLCIKEGEKVWTVFIDIYTMNDDGNLLDAAGIGAIAALKKAYVPKYDEKEDKVIRDEPSKEKVPLTDKFVFPVSIYKVGNKFLVDPTRDEEDVAETRIMIGSYNGEISSMQKSNEGVVSPEEFSEALDIQEKAWNEVFKKIEKQLK